MELVIVSIISKSTFALIAEVKEFVFISITKILANNARVIVYVSTKFRRLTVKNAEE